MAPRQSQQDIYDPDERLVFFTADLYRRGKRHTDADKLLWRTFEQHPSIELYRKVKKAVNSKEAAHVARDRAIGLLRTKLGKPEAKARWSPRELLLQVLMSEKLFAEAWEVVSSHGCSGPQLLALANASEQRHPYEALSAYSQEIERLVSVGGQSNYEAAKDLILEMHSVRDKLGQNADHDIFLADFLRRHKAKRNLMNIMQVDPFNRSWKRAN
jgi:hypothetical protein